MTGSAPSQTAEPTLPSTFQHRLLRRSRMLGKFFSVQVIVQVLGLGCGLLIVRSMSKQDYAYFTIVTTMQGALNTLTDVGIGGAMMSIGGRVWQDNDQLGRLIRTGNSLRFQLGIAVMAIIGPMLVWLLMTNGSSLALALVLTGVAGLTVLFQARVAILMVVPRLQTRISLIQNMDLFAAVSRFLLLVAAALLFMNVVVATLTAAIAFALQSWVLYRQTSRHLNFHTSPSPEFRKEMNVTALQAAPNALFSCLQGQLMVWLISIFGTSSAVADVGALGRPAAVLGIVTSFCGNLLFPRFARAKDLKAMVGNYLLVVTVYLAASGAMIGATWLFPHHVLWLLGDKYQHLSKELVLMMIVIMIGYGNSMLYGLNLTRGWVRFSWLNVPLTILVLGVTIPLSDLTTVHGVTIMSLLGLLPMFFINIAVAINGFRIARREALKPVSPSSTN